MLLNDIAFPVYKLGNTAPSKKGTVCYYEKENEKGITVSVIDDLSIPQDTLGKRRLLLSGLEDIKLFKISQAFFFLGDLIKIATKGMWFIDSNGKTFEYKKSVFIPLEFYKIEGVTEIIGGCLIALKGLPQRFKVLYRPTEDELYAGILKVNAYSYIFYGYSKEQYKRTVRKI
jgi:hypothetical protein